MFTSALNPNVVKTALDNVFMQEFQVGMGPGIATAENAVIFKQDTVDKAAIILEVFKGTGLWGQKAETADVANATPRVTNQITFTVTEFAQSVDIPKTFFDDNMHGVYEKMVRDMAESGRVTRETNAFKVYRNAFTTSLTADGITLCSASHVTLSGDTVSNTMTGVLSDANLNTAIVTLIEQKAQDGTIRGLQPVAILVPSALYKTACVITESVLRSGTANNDMNVYSSKYGIEVYTSPYIGSAAGGSDTAWFLLARNHSVTRWVREAVHTELVPFQYQRNNVYIYKGAFREVVGAIDYAGIVGSTGTV